MVTINNEVFPSEYFLNQEAIYKKTTLNPDGNTITMKFEDNRDIANMLMAAAWIHDELGDDTPIILDMPYVPYSAMDREINDQIFSLKLFGKEIEQMGFKKVIVLDPHNKEVLEQFISNIEYIDINGYTSKVIDEFKPDFIFFPDKGAMIKYPSLVDTKGIPVIHGDKHRNLSERGMLATYNVITDGKDVKGKRILIIDDICRKGGTFVWAGEELKKLGVAEIGLYVSHCEACIFDGKLLDNNSPVSVIYTNDSEPAFIARGNESFTNKEKMKKIVLV